MVTVSVIWLLVRFYGYWIGYMVNGSVTWLLVCYMVTGWLYGYWFCYIFAGFGYIVTDLVMCLLVC